MNRLSTAAQGAYFNVLINCSSYRNNTQALEILAGSKSDFIAVKELTGKGLELIEKKLA